MPIDFRCTRCGKLLRVGDESAGKKSRCPDCGNIQDIPSSPATPAGSPSFGTPEGSPASGYSSDGIGEPSSAAIGRTPMGGSSYGGNPFRQTAGSTNPYAAPISGPAYPGAYAGPMPEHVALGRLQTPAIILIAFAVLALAFIALALLGFILETIEGRGDDDSVPVAIFIIINIPMRIVMLWGAVSMLRLKNYPLSMAAAVIPLVPCGCCGFLDLPFGIWALVVLCDAGVRSAFK
jgi:phage FluMu protein Com